MLYKFLLVLLIIDAIVLVAAILLQSGKGGGLAASFGGASSSDQLLGSRQAGNLLTSASWWCGGIFMGLAFVLQLSGSRNRVPTSVLDKSFAPAKAATAPATKNASPAPVGNGVLQSVPDAKAPVNAPAKAPATAPAKP
jgi:preprotein translocase subunit SecG